MKTKSDDGPIRKICGSRKRISSGRYESGMAKKQSTKRITQETKREISQETGTWNFKNSFCSENKKYSHTTGICTGNIVEKNKWTDLLPKHMAAKPDLSDSGMLDTSDALFADLDIDLFNDSRQGSRIKATPVKKGCKTVCTTDSEISNERQENDAIFQDLFEGNSINTVPESPDGLNHTESDYLFALKTRNKINFSPTNQHSIKKDENLDLDSSFCFDAWESPIGQSKSVIQHTKRKLRNTSPCLDNNVPLSLTLNNDSVASKSSVSCVNISECDKEKFCRTSTPKKPKGHTHCDNVTHFNKGNERTKNHLTIYNRVNSERGKKENHLNIENHPNELDPKTPKSVHTEGLSLKDKIKKQMQKNASVVTPTRGILGQLHEEILSRERDEAARFEPKGTDVDIGPFYGLPSKVQKLLETQRGITKLYDWQEECLQIPAVLEGRNLIYSLPTSGGKTLVAEILILRELLCKKKDVILVLPFVSIVQEKVRNLSVFAVELNFLVEEYAASKGRFPPIRHRKSSSLYIATIEKAHSLINSFIELKKMDSLGLVVVDELHMIGEGGSRGATMEAMLLKTLHCGTSQIVGMTATLNNAKDLQVFLHAEIYSNDFRPVKLTEYVKIEDNIFSVNNKALCPDEKLQHERVVMFPYSSEIKKQDPDHLLGLVLEVIPKYSCLVFCATKKNCENVALMLCRLMNKYNKKLTDVKKEERKALLKELYKDGEGQICSVLQYTIRFGLAYHHSGLTMDERRLIEDAYSDGTLCLLTCTSTLAAGVNLPAKRVILRSPYVATEFIGHNQYKQMTGRAGRAGIDSSGESILIANRCDKDKLLDLLMGPYDMCHSSLMHDEGKGIRKLLLSAIGLQIVTNTDEVFALMEKTLLAVQSKTLQHDVALVTKNALQQLIDLKLVIQRKQTLSQDGSTEFCLEVSSLGKATFKGSVDIDNSKQLYEDLKKAEESLVLASHLHLLFLVTPYDLTNNIKSSLPWMVYFKQMSTLTPVELKVASLIGVPESYVARKASGQSTRQKVDEFVVSRFFLTLILYNLWQQKSIWDVSSRFQYPRGFVQNLLSTSASFASCVFHFCQELEEFWAFQDLLGNFVKRLTYCVSMELIPLMEIPGVKLGRARQLYRADVKTLQSVVSADPDTLVKNIEHLSHRSARQIIASAQVLLKEKTDALMEEVEDLVRLPQHIS